MKKGQVTIQ